MRIATIIIAALMQSCGNQSNSSEQSKNGPIVKLNDNGDTLEVVNYSNGKKEGPHHLFSDTGHKMMTTQFKSDSPVYEYWYHENGIVGGEGPMSNGVKNGEWKSYDEIGNLKMVYQYIDNEVKGKFVQYYPNGSIEQKGEDMGDGLFELFDTTGNLIFKATLKNGKPVDTLFVSPDY